MFKVRTLPIVLIAFVHRPAFSANRKGSVEVGYELDVKTADHNSVIRNRPYVSTTLNVPVRELKSADVSVRADLRVWGDAVPPPKTEPPQTKAEAVELVAKARLGLLQLRAGLQSFTWGETFALQVADVVNPSDLTEFPFGQSQWRKLSVAAIDALVATDSISVEGIYVPISRRPRVGTAGLPPHTHFPKEEKFPEQAEGGGKIRTMLFDTLDLSLMAYSHESRIPQLLPTRTGLEIKFPRTLTLALSLSAGGESVVLRADSAWHKKEPTLVQGLPSDPIERINTVAGGEWTSRSGVTMGLQGHIDVFPSQSPLPNQEPSRSWISGRFALAESLFILQPELMVFSGIDNRDLWASARVSWPMTNSLTWDLSYHWISAIQDSGWLYEFRDGDRLMSRLFLKL